LAAQLILQQYLDHLWTGMVKIEHRSKILVLNLINRFDCLIKSSDS
jgi:hypothetical protein